MKKRHNTLRKAKFILCCAIFTFICVFGSAASFADGAETAALFDRDGEVLTEENFPYYADALDTFGEYLSTGDSLKLTIDLDLQQTAETLIEENPGYLAADYAAVAAVVLDVKTGAPLALVNCGADPLSDTYTPYQLFLPCTVLAALSNEIVEPDTLIHCEGVFTRYEDDGIAPECWIWNAAPDGHLTHPDENLRTALRDSCYYYFYSLGNDLGIDALAEYARSLGLGEATGIELPSTQGVLASRELKSTTEPWHIGDTLQAAVGRSVSEFSPLQYAQYAAAIANNGQRYSASIIEQIQPSDGGQANTREPQLISRTPEMNEENWKAVQQGLFGKINDLDYVRSSNGIDQVMAGTLSSASEDDGITKNLFAGYAPFEQPEIAIAVAVSVTGDTPISAYQIAYEIMEEYMELK